MKLKRFVAADMRSALSLIKEELGAEAVIMSNKRVAEGVEIIAGVETDSLELVKADAKKKTSSRTIKDDEVTLSKAATSPKGSKVSERKSSEFAKSLLEILERENRNRARYKNQLLSQTLQIQSLLHLYMHSQVLKICSNRIMT